MESITEKLVWLVIGVIVTIFSQNFINDPIKDWRAKRSKRYGKRRVEDLHQELKLVQDMASRQSETTLKYIRSSYVILWFFFFMLGTLSGVSAIFFLAFFFPIARGEETLNIVSVITGTLTSTFAFFLFNNFRKESKAAVARITSILDLEAYQANVKEKISEIEESIAK